MSLDSSTLLCAAAGLSGTTDDLDWLVGLLREMMTAVVAEDADTLKKAGMIARLGALALRAFGAAELKRDYREMESYCAELEERLAVLEARAADAQAPPRPLPPSLGETAPAAEPRQAPRASVIPPRGGILAPAAQEAEAFPIVTIGAPSART